ncbi:hypothetical protein [Shimazuella kribbensis]|uniref:hypothetical protein n=1 Tax=Shimazuella kribbensis TaxID=139808 RepID=UPI0004218AF4|nr:hypothetical protein [Shimazuella kribbensis]
MSDYKVRVEIAKHKLPSVDMETKIHEFQSIFSTVASRYYRHKFQGRDQMAESDRKKN